MGIFEVYDRIKNLDWGAGWRAAGLFAFNTGDPVKVIEDVKSGRGLLAFLLLGVAGIVIVVATVVATGTFGQHSFQRAFSLASEDGLMYVRDSFAFLAFSFVWLAFLIWAYGRVLTHWIGAHAAARLFWMGLCIPASFVVLVLNALMTLSLLLNVRLLHGIVAAPHDAWIVMVIISCLICLAIWLFVRLAAARFRRVFSGTSLNPREQRGVAVMSAALLMACFASISLTGESLEFVPGHHIVDQIRDGNLPALSATVMVCQADATYVECAVTLWPKEFQDYVIFNRLRQVALGGDPPAVDAAVPATAWQLFDAGEAVSWLRVAALEPMEITIRAERAELCDGRVRRLKTSRFEAVARAKLEAGDARMALRIPVDHGDEFRDELKVACASAI